MSTYSHLHAIESNRYVATELVRLATFTLPQGITCRHCMYILALVTDGVHFVSDSRAMEIFAPQISAIQRALDSDHETGHKPWRYLSDGAVVIRQSHTAHAWE